MNSGHRQQGLLLAELGNANLFSRNVTLLGTDALRALIRQVRRSTVAVETKPLTLERIPDSR